MANNRTEEQSEAAVTHNGGGFRAISTQAGIVEWSCKHVHFSDRSARNCAEQHLKLAPPDRTPAG